MELQNLKILPLNYLKNRRKIMAPLAPGRNRRILGTLRERVHELEEETDGESIDELVDEDDDWDVMEEEDDMSEGIGDPEISEDRWERDDRRGLVASDMLSSSDRKLSENEYFTMADLKKIKIEQAKNNIRPIVIKAEDYDCVGFLVKLKSYNKKFTTKVIEIVRFKDKVLYYNAYPIDGFVIKIDPDDCEIYKAAITYGTQLIWDREALREVKKPENKNETIII